MGPIISRIIFLGSTWQKVKHIIYDVEIFLHGGLSLVENLTKNPGEVVEYFYAFTTYKKETM